MSDPNVLPPIDPNALIDPSMREPAPPEEPPADTQPETPEEPQPETDAAPPEEPQPEPIVDDHSHAHGEAVHPPDPRIPLTGNTQMWFRSTTFLDYFGNNYDKPTNNDQFWALVNFLNFGTDTHFKKTWQLSTSVRVDTHDVFNAKTQPICDTNNDDGAVSDTERAQCNFGPDYRVERFQLRFGNKYVEVTGGDFNVNFSQGIGLAVRKIADIGVDATVKGGRVDIKTKYIDLTGIGGVANRQQSDFATRQLFRDPGYPHGLCEQLPGLTQNKYGNRVWTSCSDIISGGRFDAKLPGKLTVGGHYVFIWFGQKLDLYQHDGMHLVGG